MLGRSRLKLAVVSVVTALIVLPAILGASAQAEDRVLNLADGTQLRFGLSVPDLEDGELAPLVIGLHYGWSGSNPPAHYGRDFMNLLVQPALAELNAVIVAPDCPGYSWTDPRSEAAIMELVAAIREEFSIDPDRIVMTGYSLGGVGTWAFAARHPELLSAAIPMAGRPTDGAVDSWGNLPVYAIHGLADEVIPIAATRTAIAVLAGRGVNAELIEVPGLEHFQTAWFTRPLREAIPWLRRVWSEGD